jgi:hypothetical protein
MSNNIARTRMRPLFTPLAASAFDTLDEEPLRGLLRALCGDVDALDSPHILAPLIRNGVLTNSETLAKGLIASGVRIPKPRR